MSLTPYHAKYFAYDLTPRASSGMDRLSMSLFDAAVDLNPHQIEAALFALQSPLSKGVILADEVGLGKSIEAGIVDLLETFNWLIGLTVRHIAAPHMFKAAFERDKEKRLKLKGSLKQEAGGPFWFRTVTGTTPDGRRTLVIWRKFTGNPEEDNRVLDEGFTKQGYSSKDSEFDLIYVNGGNNLENLKAPDDTWKVRLMFDTDGA